MNIIRNILEMYLYIDLSFCNKYLHGLFIVFQGKHGQIFTKYSAQVWHVIMSSRKGNNNNVISNNMIKYDLYVTKVWCIVQWGK